MHTLTEYFFLQCASMYVYTEEHYECGPAVTLLLTWGCNCIVPIIMELVFLTWEN